MKKEERSPVQQIEDFQEAWRNLGNELILFVQENLLQTIAILLTAWVLTAVILLAND